MPEMAVPSVEVRWIPDAPRTLVLVVLRFGDDENNLRCGKGSTLAEAFADLAFGLRFSGEMEEDNRIRKILGGP